MVLKKPTHVQLPIGVWNSIDMFLGQSAFKKVEVLINTIRKEMKLVGVTPDEDQKTNSKLPVRCNVVK